MPLVDPTVTEEQRVRLAQRLGAPMDTPVQAVSALASTGDPWLRSCAAYAIGALGLPWPRPPPSWSRGAPSPTRSSARPCGRRR